MNQDLALYNGKITTLNSMQPELKAIGIADGRIVTAGNDNEVLSKAPAEAKRGDAFFRMNGAGEMLAFSAADFEDFLEPRPEIMPVIDRELLFNALNSSQKVA